MKKFNKGQAVVETLISTSFLILIFSGGVSELINAEKQATNELVNSRKVIWTYQFDEESLNKSSNYRMEERFGVILNPISQLVSLGLPMDNLWETETTIFPMVKLNDGWETKSSADLSARPARLVVNAALSGSITSLVQDGLGSLFLSKELKSDSLKFGHIDVDVVPEDALIQECQNDC